MFVKEGCPSCPAAREVAGQFNFAKVYDLDDPDGLAEASFYSVLSTPSFVLVGDDGEVIRPWRGSVPRPQEIGRAAGF